MFSTGPTVARGRVAEAALDAVSTANRCLVGMQQTCEEDCSVSRARFCWGASNLGKVVDKALLAKFTSFTVRRRRQSLFLQFRRRRLCHRALLSSSGPDLPMA